VKDAEVCYVGDDLTDLPLLTRVGLGVCVANGDDLVRQHAHFCTRRAGGSGAVREAIELILTAQGKWDGILKSYLRGDRALILKTTDESDRPYPLRPESPRRTARGGDLPNLPK
jgi:hypothetical protein